MSLISHHAETQNATQSDNLCVHQEKTYNLFDKCARLGKHNN